MKRSKFMQKICVEINNDARGTYITNRQIKFNIKMVQWSTQNYRDKPALNNDGLIIGFADNATTDMYNFNTKNVEIILPLK